MKRRHQAASQKSGKPGHRSAAKPAPKPFAKSVPKPLEPLAPPPPSFRDPWAWVSALAVLPILIHAWGAPLGEAVAEDFDFLHRVLFSKTHTLLDGGGSTAFWRPVAHQLYYESMGRLILTQPAVVSAIHFLLLALSSLLLYRTFRRVWPGPAAAAVATFPLLSESTRTLISWPSHFVDLGVWLFTAIALHETAARRLWSTLLALLAALLCKEVAVVAALLLPWMPGLGPRDRKERIRWAVATAAITAVWAVAYVAVRHAAHLALPHHLETRADVLGTPLHRRLWWAAWNSVRALFSLPAVQTVWGGPVLLTLWVLLALALAFVLFRARARLRLERFLPLGTWGAAWFLAASATLVPIFPIWAPNRSGYGSLGFGAMMVALTAAAHPVLLGALVGLRLAAFALSPGPPPEIVGKAPDQGAFMDFVRLVRLQRLMRDTRVMLKSHYPTLRPGSQIGQHYLPRMSEYAFGGSKALQVWYSDTTLRWVRYADFTVSRDSQMVAIAEFQGTGGPQMAAVNTEAMIWFLRTLDAMKTGAWTLALERLALADSLQRDTTARVFRGEIEGQRATCLTFQNHLGEAEFWAHRGIAHWPENIYAHFALGYMEYLRGRFAAAEAQLDTVLRYDIQFTTARDLYNRVRQRIRAMGGTTLPARP